MECDTVVINEINEKNKKIPALVRLNGSRGEDNRNFVRLYEYFLKDKGFKLSNDLRKIKNNLIKNNELLPDPVKVFERLGKKK